MALVQHDTALAAQSSPISVYGGGLWSHSSETTPLNDLDIAPGVKWLRLPLPFMLNHINVWLLQDGDGWAIGFWGHGSERR